MNLELNSVKSQRKYNNKTTYLSYLIRALVRVLPRSVNALQPANLHLRQYSSSCAVKVSTLELELKRFLKTSL